MARRTAAERKQEAARMFQISEEARVNRERIEARLRVEVERESERKVRDDQQELLEL